MDHPRRPCCLLTCGRSIGEAFWLMHTLERACTAQIAALAGGSALHPVTDRTSQWFGALLTKSEFSLRLGDQAWPALRRLLDSTDPPYQD